jgi:hypothetical protein
MRYYAVFLAVGMLLPCAAWAQKQMYAIPTQKEVPVYQNEMRKIYEKPLFVMEEQGRYIVKEKGKDAIKIQDRDGKTGWVESGRVKIVSENKLFVYEPAEVQKWLDYPQPLIVFGGDSAIQNPVILDRSFADALRENVDQETINRQVN